MSNITIKLASPDVINDWNHIVDCSPQGSLYHYREWLTAMALNSNTKLLSFVAFKGNQTICLFPVFVKNMFNLSALFSPPPGCAVPYLGPVFLTQDLKARDIESIHTAIIDKFDLLWKKYRFDIINIVATPGLNDIRAFYWNNYAVYPSYEYVVHINNDMFSLFHNETRTKIRRAKKYNNLSITQYTEKYFSDIVNLTKDRYLEQGVKWGVENSYVRHLIKELNGNHFSAYVAEYESKIITGMISYEYKDTCFDWIGGINPTEKLSGVNELLHWTILDNAEKRGLRHYNLGGANTQHLSKSKSKYSPKLISYYHLYKATRIGNLVYNLMQKKWLKNLYKKMQNT